MRLVYLSGGVGGARLLDGLARVAEARGDELTAIVNVGDDFEHLGLCICPDLDSVMYTLSGLGDEARGWGLAGETFRALEMVARYGGPGWFQLGDADLGTHVLRSAWLREGATLSTVTARLCEALAVRVRVLPASDERHATFIDTERDGTLSFQDWLVRQRAVPAVRAVRFEGSARPSTAVLETLERAELIVIGPSNPYVSIDPITVLPGVRERVALRSVVAISPIVSGRAVKGPLGEMIPKLAGRPASASAIAAHYGSLIHGMVVQSGDDGALREEHPRIAIRATETVMHTREDRVALAQAALELGLEVKREREP
jgi:LPPG:FO 2-phospho-L-lactate transferase